MGLFTSSDKTLNDLVAKIDADIDVGAGDSGLPESTMNWLKDPEADGTDEEERKRLRKKHFSDEDWLAYYKAKRDLVVDDEESSEREIADVVGKYREYKKKTGKSDGGEAGFMEAVDPGSADSAYRHGTVVDAQGLPGSPKIDFRDLNISGMDAQGAAWAFKRWYDRWHLHVVLVSYMLTHAWSKSKGVRNSFVMKLFSMSVEDSSPFDAGSAEEFVREVASASLMYKGDEQSTKAVIEAGMKASGARELRAIWDRLEDMSEGRVDEHRLPSNVDRREVKLGMGAAKEFRTQVKYKMIAMAKVIWEFASKDIEGAHLDHLLSALFVVLVYDGGMTLSPKEYYRRVRRDYDGGWFSSSPDNKIGNIVQDQSLILNKACVRGKHTDIEDPDDE